jgi:hypothetical protein
VLSINTELTNVIRQLTRDQAALVSSINQLTESQKAPAMPTTTEHTVAQRLAELRSPILAQVADQLSATLPMIGVAPYNPGRDASHHANMYATAQRFHDLVQLGATIDWGMIRFEYAWAARTLRPKGVTWDHQTFLIETYFAIASRLANWSDEERAILGQIARHLYAEGALAYAEEVAYILSQN